VVEKDLYGWLGLLFGWLKLLSGWLKLFSGWLKMLIGALQKKYYTLLGSDNNFKPA
jgi:hypothetical protein